MLGGPLAIIDASSAISCASESRWSPELKLPSLEGTRIFTLGVVLGGRFAAGERFGERVPSRFERMPMSLLFSCTL